MVFISFLKQRVRAAGISSCLAALQTIFGMFGEKFTVP
jgi:hypothetical protein